MFTSFQEYAAVVKPSLEIAFCSELTRLTGFGFSRHRVVLPGLTDGKMIRGTLLCLVAATLGGRLDAALPRAVAVELIQTASLIHDDFVDQHRTRRGLPALWTLEGPRRAVLLGDLLFSSAIFLLNDLGREEGRIGSRAIARLSSGAWQEPVDTPALLREMDAGMAGYEKIIALKTGVLFAAACELGAVAAGADPTEQQRWRRFGLKIGEGYQLADDLHEMEGAIGKSELTAAELTDLAPALLFFVPESRPALAETLRRREAALSRELAAHLQKAVGLMKTARERKLAAAAAELDGIPHKGPLMRLVRRTPFDLVGMFDGAVSSVAGGAG